MNVMLAYVQLIWLCYLWTRIRTGVWSDSLYSTNHIGGRKRRRRRSFLTVSPHNVSGIRRWWVSRYCPSKCCHISLICSVILIIIISRYSCCAFFHQCSHYIITIKDNIAKRPSITPFLYTKASFPRHVLNFLLMSLSKRMYINYW